MRAGGRRCCSNCEGGFEAVDVTATARAVMRCVKELRGRFGKSVVADVLCGSKSAKVMELHLDQSACYGTVDASAAEVKEVIELLAAGGYLEISEGKYPLVGYGPRAREASRDDFVLTMKRVARKRAHTKRESAAGHVFGGGVDGVARAATDSDQELFERLRVLRKRIADEAGVPPYIVFSDAALRDMCARRPVTDEEFLQVNGVGATKLARYGKDFTAEIAAFGKEEAGS